MANVIINDAHLTDIADAIRAKGGTTATYLPSEMADAITAIESGSGGGGSTTTGISHIGFGVVGKTGSGYGNNKISFPYQAEGFNLKTLKWKVLFYLEDNDSKYRGIWRYDSATKKCEKMTEGNASQATVKNIFICDPMDDTNFKDIFPDGIMMDLASSTNYFYVSAMDVSSGRTFSSSSFNPIIWVE